MSFDYECDDSDDCRDNSNKEGCGTVINFLHLIILLPITQLLLLTTILLLILKLTMHSLINYYVLYNN